MSRVGARLLVAVGIVLAATAVWTRPPASPPSVAQLQRLLPPGSVLRGLVRLQMTGPPPLDAAGVAVVPRYPGAQDSVYVAFVFLYDRWRKHPVQIYSAPLAGLIPLSPDALPIGGGREAAVFNALRENGTPMVRVVKFFRGQLRIRDEGAAVLATIPPSPPGVTWRYWVHGGAPAAQTLAVRLKPRQPVQLALSGGGPTPIVIPDARLDIVEQGYRARQPGTYTIRISLPFAIDSGLTLTLLVEAS